MKRPVWDDGKVRDTRYDKRAPPLRLVSVPHTGTVFTRYVLGLMGLRDLREGGKDYLSHHTYEFQKGLKLPDDVRPVVPLRDPMLAECSRINRGGFGADVRTWDDITALKSPHYFRVQLPDGASERTEIVRLANYVGKGPPDSFDWKPRNAKPYRNDIKIAYLAGELPDVLRPAWDWLRQSESTRSLFRTQGYDLRWMR